MKVLITIFLLFLTANSFARTGIAEISFLDSSRDREILTKILYPTTNKEASSYAENAAFYGFAASLESLISKDKLPLYIFAHGTSGNWKNLSWLASELAENAIVVSANHPSYTTGQASPESVLKPWDQAKDISFIISKIINSEYGKYIDDRKIAVIGHSLGGYTSMALSGAEIDLQKYVDFCKKAADKSCIFFKTALAKLNKAHIQKAKQSLTDDRVKASIALAPGFVESMTKESLESLVSPVLIIGAEYDKNVPPKTHFANIPKNIEYHQVEDASHFSFLQLCKPQALAILAEEGAEFVCEDGNIRSRKSIHKEVLMKIRSFLSKIGV